MNWRDHASNDELDVLEDPSQHGTRTFRLIAARVLDVATFRLVKAQLHEREHAHWEMAWSRGKNDPLIVGLKSKIIDILEELDQKTGAHGHKGAAWMDKKWEELKSHFHALTT